MIPNIRKFKLIEAQSSSPIGVTIIKYDTTLRDVVLANRVAVIHDT